MTKEEQDIRYCIHVMLTFVGMTGSFMLLVHEVCVGGF